MRGTQVAWTIWSEACPSRSNHLTYVLLEFLIARIDQQNQLHVLHPIMNTVNVETNPKVSIPTSFMLEISSDVLLFSTQKVENQRACQFSSVQIVMPKTNWMESIWRMKFLQEIVLLPDLVMFELAYRVQLEAGTEWAIMVGIVNFTKFLLKKFAGKKSIIWKIGFAFRYC